MLSDYTNVERDSERMNVLLLSCCLSPLSLCIMAQFPILYCCLQVEAPQHPLSPCPSSVSRIKSGVKSVVLLEAKHDSILTFPYWPS